MFSLVFSFFLLLTAKFEYATLQMQNMHITHIYSLKRGNKNEKTTDSSRKSDSLCKIL